MFEWLHKLMAVLVLDGRPECDCVWKCPGPLETIDQTSDEKLSHLCGERFFPQSLSRIFSVVVDLNISARSSIVLFEGAKPNFNPRWPSLRSGESYRGQRRFIPREQWYYS